MTKGVLYISCVAAMLTVGMASAQGRERNSGNVQDVDGRTQHSTPITVTGCLVRQSDSSAHPTGSETPGGGTLASTNVGGAPTGSAASGSVNRGDGAAALVLITTAPEPRPRPTSAVPGSIPSGTDSGTVPAATAAGTSGRAPAAVTTAYRLTFNPEVQPAQYVGQRLEVTGVVNDEKGRNGEGTEVARGGSATTGTRAEVAATPVAHPSSAIPQLTVTTFKAVQGRCDAQPGERQ